MKCKKIRYIKEKKVINRYTILKEDRLRMTRIKENNIKKSFTNYEISLEDKNGNQYLYNIRTIKNKNEIVKDWNKEMSGKEWLKEDVKNEVLNRKPNMTIENDLPDHSENFETLEEFSQESNQEI